MCMWLDWLYLVRKTVISRRIPFLSQHGRASHTGRDEMAIEMLLR